MPIDKKGTLYICATPIGNLEDITLRVLNTLKTVDLIAAEDTRNSMKLLSHFDIKTKLTSYHEHNKIAKAKVLIKELESGKNVALISDAGTPAISDPGFELVKLCVENNINVTSLPGAVAFVTALTISGLKTDRICFEAFLPKDKKRRESILKLLNDEERTTIFYEAPHHLLSTLKEMAKYVEKDRKIAVVKELTKKFENVFRESIENVIANYEENPPKGEFVILVSGKDYEIRRQEEIENYNKISIKDHYLSYIEKGNNKKEAMKLVAKDRGVAKNIIYKELLKDGDNV